MIDAGNGYTIDRVEEQDHLRPHRDGALRAVEFPVAVDGAVLTRPGAIYDGRADNWYVQPGSTSSHLDPHEARARAAALLMAAAECERQNGIAPKTPPLQLKVDEVVEMLVEWGVSPQSADELRADVVGWMQTRT